MEQKLKKKGRANFKKIKMLVNIENFIRYLIACFQIAKLYGVSHPEFIKSLDNVLISLREASLEKDEIIIGIVGQELAFEKEIFFDLSKNVKLIILDLKARGIEKIIFSKYITKDDLAKFVNFLVLPKEEVKLDAKDYFKAVGLRNISVGKIQQVSSLNQEVQRSINYLNIYGEALNSVSNNLEKLIDNQVCDFITLKSNIANLMEKMLSGYPEFLKLATIKRYDITTFTHLLNVAILAMHFSSKIGFSREDVIDIGLSGLFHDIGKLYISRKILQKKSELSSTEFDKIKSHSSLGAEILLRGIDSLGILPVVVCFEHHIKYNLSGYPRLAYSIRPHIASFIISICDVYDAICQRRTYKRDYPPNLIYTLMMEEKARLFEPRLLDKFFQIMGIWPPATIVSLSDEKIAIVREENEDDIASPKVEVVFPTQNKELIDLRQTKDKLKIEFSLNPLTDGKDYLHLI